MSKLVHTTLLLYHLLMRYIVVLLMLFCSLCVHAQDKYTTITDVNLRSGAGKSYHSITILKKGDTVKLLEQSGDNWVKVQFQDKVGYSASGYFQKVKKVEKIKPNFEAEPKKESGFLKFFIVLSIIITVSIFLKKKGERHREKSTATWLSLLFGTFGLQKFYLGERNKGILSIVFYWTFIPTLVGVWDCIKMAGMNELKFNYLFNSKAFSVDEMETSPTNYDEQNQVKSIISTRSTVYLQQSKPTKLDDSIIDVNSENLDLNIYDDFAISDSDAEPAHWSNIYVYSYEDVIHTTDAIRKYYMYFKEKVLNNEFVDLKGNNNYAFVLYFDLLYEYQEHRNIELLEKQFKLIGEICPKTKSYSLQSLKNELRKRNDSYSLDKLESLEQQAFKSENSYVNDDSDDFKLGNQYKGDLGFDKQAVILLNKIYNPPNLFNTIEGCHIAIIVQYVLIMKELERKLKKDGTTLAEQVTYFKTKLKTEFTKQNPTAYHSHVSELARQFESEIYITFFKRTENLIRESFNHKRRISETLLYANKNLTEEFEDKLGVLFNELAFELKDKISKPDKSTQIALNQQNVNRWKVEFDALKKGFNKEEAKSFIDGIALLEKVNKKNSNIENIFFQASKFIAKHDKILALKYYAKYVYYDLKSKKFDNKELTKTVQKSLFKNEEQKNDFESIIAKLIETKDIKTALEKIHEIYIPKRKKIRLDRSEIEKTKQKHDKTVELLNGYLAEESNEETEIESHSGEEVKVIPSNTKESIFISEISLTKVQEELLKMITSNSYEIQQEEVEKFALENGMLKNQLIDSINDACEASLEGEMLIEEEEENYIIEESYYNEILK
ncbi:MAG: hypothetical protein ACI81T_003970 [Bacteroidia bacterium]|jgi:uncharacterized protein YgiM (DUF1202 family)